MQPVAERARQTIARYNLIPAGSRVLVALSGGGDSVALLHVLRDLAAPLRFELAGVAHLHHGLRGEQADRDEAFCRRVAADLSLPIDVGHEDVAALARARRVSIEAAGRIARQAFLRQAAQRARANVIALGHTMDDQAETFLLRLVRGAGPRGLGGIRPRLGPFVRPLLDVSREALRRYLTGRGIAFREDETNQDLAVIRNRVRHRLLPHLVADYSASIVEILNRDARIARDDEEALARLADQAADRVILSREPTVVLDARNLLIEPAAIARRVVLNALRRASGGRFAGFDDADRLLRIAAGSSPSPADLPGVTVGLEGDRLVLTSRGGRRHVRDWNRFSVLLSIPGEARVSALGLLVTADVVDQANGLELNLGGAGAVIDRDRIGTTLTIRTWRPGDRFTPLGLGGSKKLQDFFVDRKVPRSDRGRIPVVTDEQGRIVWVAGHAIDGHFRVTGASKAVVILKLKRFENLE